MQRLAVHDEELGTTYRMPPARRRGMDFGTRRLLLIGGFLTCLVVLGASLYSALNRHHSGPPPLIHASKDPIRVRPENPGGMRVLGQNDDILGADTADQASRLAPPPEAPALQALRARQQAALSAASAPSSPPSMPVPGVSSPPGATTPAADVPKVSLPVSAPPREAAIPAMGWRKEPAPMEPHAAADPVPPPLPAAPRRSALPQLASRDVGVGVAVAPPQAASVAPVPVETAPAGPVVTAPVVTAPVVAAPVVTAPVVTAPVAQPGQRSRIALAPSPSSPALPPAARATGPIALTPVAATGGTGVLVQLAAVPSEAAARAEWHRVNRVLGSLLQNHQQVVVQGKYKGNPIWRLRAGGFANRAEAAAFCGKVKAKGISCLVPRS